MAIPDSRAFTLLEMMITISVVAILVSLGVPAFQEYALKQAMSAAVNALHSDLLLARSQAIHQDMQVIACPGNPTRGCSGTNDWTHGWMVFADLNEDRQQQEDEPVLRLSHHVDNLKIFSAASRNNIRFYPNGSTPGSNGSISFCGPRGPTKARRLVISNLGRIRRDSASTLSEDKCP
jgi:type IV fimbrial biogenesis protein FimT